MSRRDPGESQQRERLEKLRETIDSLDHSLIKVLARRFSVVQRIGELKRAMKEPVLQTRRRNEILRTRKRHARELGLDPEFIARIFEFIQKEAIALQKQQIKNKRRKA